MSSPSHARQSRLHGGHRDLPTDQAHDDREVEGRVWTAGAAGGRPLDPLIRRNMERSFQTDFSTVRVHDDPAAAASARALSAKAYTVGRDVYFAEGRFAPDTPAGQRLIAHELAHVVQQGRGGSEQPSLDGSGALEADADAAASAADSGAPAIVSGSSAIGVAASPDEPWWKRAAEGLGSARETLVDMTPDSVKEAVSDLKQNVSETAAPYVEKIEEKAEAVREAVSNIDREAVTQTVENAIGSIHPSVLVASATQKLAEKTKDTPGLNEATKQLANVATANAQLNTEPLKAFATNLIKADEEGWHFQPWAATKAWQGSMDANMANMKAVTFGAVDAFEDGKFTAPARRLVDAEAHPTLAAIEEELIGADEAASKFQRQVIGGSGKALYSMVEGIQKIGVHPFDTVKGLSNLPGSSLTNPLKGAGAGAQLMEDLYDEYFASTGEITRHGNQPVEGEGKEPKKSPWAKYGESFLVDPERDAQQTKNLLKAVGENYIKAWESGRYGELPGLAVVDLGSFLIPGGKAGTVGQVGKASKLGELGNVGKLGELGDLGKLGELGDLGKAGELGDLGKAGELGDLGKAGELGDLGKAGELGDLGKAEELGDLGKAEELGDLGKAEELGDLGKAEELGDLGKAGELGDLGKAGELGDLGKAEELGAAGDTSKLADAAEATKGAGADDLSKGLDATSGGTKPKPAAGEAAAGDKGAPAGEFDPKKYEAADLGDVRGANLTAEQIAQGKKVMGRKLDKVALAEEAAAGTKPTTLKDVWKEATDRRPAATRHLENAQHNAAKAERKLQEAADLRQKAQGARDNGDLAKAKSLEKQAEKAEKLADKFRERSYTSGTKAYNAVRDKFWELVNERQDLKDIFEDAGMKFEKDAKTGGTKNAPYYETPAGKQKLTLEHEWRRSDKPTLSIDPDNLLFSLGSENSVFLEGIRGLPDFFKFLR